MKISKKIKNALKGVLNKLPYVRTLHQLNKNSKFPAGHYYSPVISLQDIKQRQNEIWSPKEIPAIEGVDLNISLQLSLLKSLSGFYAELPFPVKREEGFRFNYYNSYYSYTDAIILFGMIRKFEPTRIIEIGSGYSSALMLDTNELFFQGKIELNFIEPYCQDRLEVLIGDSKDLNCRIIEKNVQKVPVEVFEELQEGDILFVDSTHVVKTGSDVNYILFEILPRLKKGVLIHFHDIHFPFEYPREWVLNGFGWNETYFLRTFMMFNSQFEIIFFADYLHKFHKEAFADMPLTYKSTGSNFWIRKL